MVKTVKMIRLVCFLSGMLTLGGAVAAQQPTQNGTGQNPPPTAAGQTQTSSGGTASGNAGRQTGGGATSVGGTPNSGSSTSGQMSSPALTGAGGGNVVITGSAQRAITGAARQAANAPSAISLKQAIGIALDNNLATLLAAERKREAEGLKQEARSPLLPNISGTTYQANVTQNLVALGFQASNFGGNIPTFVGPFNNFDARARLVQSIFNLGALRNYRAGKAGVHVAEAQEQLAREQVASGTALLYLEVLRADRSAAAANANVELAQTLVKLAQDQRDAGVATGVDVTRAQVRLAAEQVRQAQAENTAAQARLNLQRVVGLPLGAALTLTDPLVFAEETLPTPETLITEAQGQRPEIRIADAQLAASRQTSAAVRAENYPSLEFVGDYGVSGITPTDTALPTRRAAIQLNVPIFNGGLTRGRQVVAESRTRQLELELGDVRGQVEQDVRLALATLRTAAAQVRAADEGVALAERETQMARDRFSAGVADNLEVVNAQTSLANARDAQVTALALYNAARLNLAAATGRAETFHW